MASITVTNLAATPTFVRDMYCTLGASGAVNASATTTRSMADLSAMAGLHALVAAGTVSLTYTRSADEIASGLDLPAVVEGADNAAVAAATIPSDSGIFRLAFTGLVTGAADDVTIYAANALPFKFRVVNAWALLTAATGASTLAIRTRAAGAGTLVGTLDSGTTGYKPLTTTTASTLITPATLDGLFLRRSDRAVAGEIFVQYRRET